MHNWFQTAFVSSSAAQLGAELLVLSLVIVAAGLAVHFLTRARFPLFCSSLWNAVLLTLLLLPAAFFLPPVPVPVPERVNEQIQLATATVQRALPAEQVVETGPPAQSTAGAPSRNVPPTETMAANDAAPLPLERRFYPTGNWPLVLIGFVYAAGLIFIGCRLTRSAWRVRALLVSATPVTDERWSVRLTACRERMQALHATSKGNDIRLMESDETQIPFTVGHLRPAIVLPDNLVREATPADADAILLHELTHIARGDYLWQWILKSVQAVYWVNPLVWLAGRLIHATRESACDRYCLHVLGNRQQYMECLLNVASSLVRTVSIPVAVPMARSPRIAGRLRTISTGSGLQRCVASRPTRCCLLLAAIVAGGIMGAGVEPIAKAVTAAVDQDGRPLPDGAVARLGSQRLRHGERIAHLLYSTDGKRLASWGDNNSLRIWDSQTGQLLKTCHCENGTLVSLSLLAEGRSVAIVQDYQGEPHVWRFESEPHPELPVPPQTAEVAVPGGEAVVDLDKPGHYCLSPDGKTLAVGTVGASDKPRFVELFRFDPGKPIDELESTQVAWTVPGNIDWLSFAPDGSSVVTVTRTGEDVQNVITGENRVADWHATAIDVKTGKITSQFDMPTPAGNGTLRALAIAPNGKVLALGSAKGAIHLFDLNSGQEVTHFENKDVGCVVFSPDGKKLAAAGHDMTVHVWDIEKKAEIATMKGHHSWIEAVTFSPDGRTIASGGQDNLIRMWDVASGQEIHVGDGHEFWIEGVALSNDGKTAVSGAADGTIRIWDAQSGKQKAVVKPPETKWIYQVAISLDDKEFIVSETARNAATGRVAAYDLATGKETWHFTPPQEKVHFVSVNYDRRNHFAAVANDGGVFVWDASKKDGHRGEIRAERKQREEARTKAGCLSPDGNHLALASSTNMAASSEIEIWKFWGNESDTVRAGPEFEQLRTIVLDKGYVDHLEFSPDGKRLASCGHSSQRGWLDGDGRVISSPRFEDSVILWDVATGDLIRKFGLHREHLPSVRYTNDAKFSPDGKLLITAERDGSILIYDVETGNTLADVPAHANETRSIAISADGRRFASVSTDLTGLVWDLEKVLTRNKQ